MGDYIVRRRVKWMAIGLLGLLFLGCKPGRPEFALPKIKMITGENLHSVCVFNPKEVSVFGNYGVIYHTSTGGAGIEDWTLQESGIEELLLCEATFIDRNSGWAVGTKGTIIHTLDGGKKWVTQESGTEKNLFSVSFVDAQNGWVVGEFGTILHTTDGGERWKEQRCEDIETKVDMFSFDWKPTPALYEVDFIDRDRGWIVGMEGIILKTENGGKKWRKLETNCDIPLYSIDIKGNKGWAVGNRGYYLLSLDGGETWVVKDGLIKTRFWLRDVAFSDENNGWIVGAMGTVAHSTDGGMSWELVSGLSYDMPEYGLADF